MDHEHHQQPVDSGRANNRSKIVFALMLGIAAFFLLSEHRAHFLGALPFLLLLACPLLHMFHHGGHGSNKKSEAAQDLKKAHHE